MKQNQINKAYNALNRIANMSLPIRDSHNVYLLMKQLEPSYKFEAEQERKLMEKYGGTIGDDGAIRFEDREGLIGFRGELEELGNFEPEIEFKPITISLDAMENQKLTPIDIMNLDGFVAFE